MDNRRLAFRPRLLYLYRDPARMREQLHGTSGDRQPEDDRQPGGDWQQLLRDDVSTDEISPLPAMVHFDATLGRHAYTGFTTGGERPIGRDAVKRGGFEVVVAGRRYGKGSSREHSVVAELSAGVRLVIAPSFERIYRQNADNLGLFTSTDLGLAARIERGEAIGLDELLAGRDALAAAILRQGGLLKYGRARFGAGALPAPAVATAATRATGENLATSETGETVATAATANDARPQTLFHKIVARHLIGPGPLAAGEGGFVRADLRFIHEYYTGMCAHLLEQEYGDALRLVDAASIVAFEDHLSYVHESPVHVANDLVGDVRRLSQAHRRFVAAHGLTHHGYLRADLAAGDPANAGSEGISHAVIAERYALPGQLVVGTDSHTPHSGALGCVAFGVGSTDMANAFVTGAVRFTMPEVLRVELEGTLLPGVAAKDIALHLLADPAIRAGLGVGKVFEFAGDVVRRLGIDERATLTNMTAELGGFTGIVAPDEETIRYLAERRGIAFEIEPWMASDPGAAYAAVIRVDVSHLSPMVARPGDPGNGLPLSRLEAPVRIDIAYGGSCTAGKREDFDHYHAVLAWAAERGMRVAPGVAFFLQFGTDDVRDYCLRRG